MHSVITKLTLSKPLDDAILGSIDRDLFGALGEKQGFVDCHLVSVSETEAVIIVLFDSLEALNKISSEVAGPWFAENIRPYLGGPVDRAVGEVVASTQKR